MEFAGFHLDYYGPNTALRAALKKHANTWRMIEREAKGNHRKVEMETGELQRTYPDIRIRTGDDDRAAIVVHWPEAIEERKRWNIQFVDVRG